jgi:hypothetical protein
VWKRLSYANVVASLALFLTLGGVGYAATQLPNNSVGTPQLKANAVTSGKVKNGTLRKADFKSGQLPKGAKGDQGAQGAKGDQGIQGPIGPSDAYAALRNTISPPVLTAGVTTTLLTLSIPVAGNYVIFSKLPLDDAIAGSRLQTCTLAAGSDTDATLVLTTGIGGWECNNEVIHTFTSPGVATLSITTAAGSAVRGGDGKIIAVRVGAVVNSTVTG